MYITQSEFAAREGLVVNADGSVGKKVDVWTVGSVDDMIELVNSLHAANELRKSDGMSAITTRRHQAAPYYVTKQSVVADAYGIFIPCNAHITSCSFICVLSLIDVSSGLVWTDGDDEGGDEVDGEATVASSGGVEDDEGLVDDEPAAAAHGVSLAGCGGRHHLSLLRALHSNAERLSRPTTARGVLSELDSTRPKAEGVCLQEPSQIQEPPPTPSPYSVDADPVSE